MPHPRPVVLVIDDEAPIRRAIANALASSAQVVESASSADGIDAVAAQRPDLVILDLGLPDGDGIDVVRAVRAWSTVPILVLSARYSDADKVALLDAGVDDYVTKPFSPQELAARARALLRRSTADTSEPRLVAGSLVLDRAARVFTRGDVPIHLTATEWSLLAELMSHAGRTLTHQHLFRAVWSGRVAGDAQQYLRVYVASLRRKIEDDPLRPRFIVTEVGAGYRFVTPVERAG